MKKKVVTQMWIRNFRRFIAEAFSGMIKNGLMTVASIIVVTSCLFIFGVFMVVTMNVNHVVEQIADQCQIQAYITKEAKYGGQIQNISNTIKKIKHVDSVSFETGEKTFKDFKKSLSSSEKQSFSGLPDDVISDSFKITLDDLSYAKEVADKLGKIDGVESVANRQDVVNIINKYTRIIKRVSMWIVIIFMLISIFIISNTIKLTVHNRRREINIMKYVGATDAYIRWPFVFEGIFAGLISAAIAFAITDSCYVAVSNAITSGISSMTFMFGILKFSNIWQIIACSYVLLGAAIGALGSIFSVRKYLKV